MTASIALSGENGTRQEKWAIKTTIFQLAKEGGGPRNTHVKTVTDIHAERAFQASPGEARGGKREEGRGGAGKWSSHVKLET